jgi:GTP-binding protein
VPESHVGTAVDLLGQRRGQMIDLQHGGTDGTAHLTYIVPTRGLLGFRYQFLTATKGTGVVHSIFHAYLPATGRIDDRAFGSLVAWEAGTATAYGLKAAEERGRLFIEPGIEVYGGMVVGQYQRPGDLTINVTKKKHMTNVRSSTQDIEVRLSPPRHMSLDEALEYLGEDELLEVTPVAFRIRKRLLDTEERGKATKKAKEELAGA